MKHYFKLSKLIKWLKKANDSQHGYFAIRKELHSEFVALHIFRNKLLHPEYIQMSNLNYRNITNYLTTKNDFINDNVRLAFLSSLDNISESLTSDDVSSEEISLAELNQENSEEEVPESVSSPSIQSK